MPANGENNDLTSKQESYDSQLFHEQDQCAGLLLYLELVWGKGEVLSPAFFTMDTTKFTFHSGSTPLSSWDKYVGLTIDDHVAFE